MARNKKHFASRQERQQFVQTLVQRIVASTHPKERERNDGNGTHSQQH